MAMMHTLKSSVARSRKGFNRCIRFRLILSNVILMYANVWCQKHWWIIWKTHRSPSSMLNCWMLFLSQSSPRSSNYNNMWFEGRLTNICLGQSGCSPSKDTDRGLAPRADFYAVVDKTSLHRAKASFPWNKAFVKLLTARYLPSDAFKSFY